MTDTFSKGAVCYINNISAYSIVKYERYKQSIPTLVCPCHIKPTQKLIIEELIVGNLALVSYADKPEKMSVILLKDLRLANK